jgi:hypothetical protein
MCEGEPAVTALASGRGALLRPVQDALDEYLGQVRERLDLLQPAPQPEPMDGTEPPARIAAE